MQRSLIFYLSQDFHPGSLKNSLAHRHKVCRGEKESKGRRNSQWSINIQLHIRRSNHVVSRMKGFAAEEEEEGGRARPYIRTSPNNLQWAPAERETYRCCTNKQQPACSPTPNSPQEACRSQAGVRAALPKMDLQGKTVGLWKRDVAVWEACSAFSVPRTQTGRINASEHAYTHSPLHVWSAW